MKRNKGFLLDTHTFIWSVEGNKRLSEKVKALISDPTNRVYVSVVTIWEIIIKTQKNKIRFRSDIKSVIEKADFKLIPIEAKHALAVGILPPYHNDPFDRMLIEQAKTEKLTLITNDQKVWKYDLRLLKT